MQAFRHRIAAAFAPFLLAVVGLAGLAGLVRSQADGPALVLSLEGAVTPASADYVVRGIETAAEEGAALVILRMDTPGGLDASMREIIRAIIASPVPVASWVGPGGARAASAGTYILLASHVAAMAPGTNIGAATPVQLGGGGGRPFGGGEQPEDGEAEAPEGFQPQNASETKAINDAIAYIRGLAELRGRNADWAERTVREAASLGASEAEATGVIDFVAPSIAALLVEADGMVVDVGEREVRLSTAELVLEERAPGVVDEILSVLTDPNVAMLLMVIGFYGIVFELLNPGALMPGVIGAISLLTGFYALSVLPVNFAGAGLMLLGLALMVAEAFAPAFGILGIGGAVAFTLGAALLIDTDAPGIELSWGAIAAVGVASLGFAFLVARLAVWSHRRRVSTGREELIGATAEVLEWRGTEGAVHVHGERWQARGEPGLAPGDAAEIVAVEGLVLRVASPPAVTPRAAEGRAE